MKKIIKLAALSTAVVFAGSAAADELLVTSSAAKGGNANAVALDYQSSGAATGLEFKLTVPKGAQVDTSKCLSQVPKSHTGVCAYSSEAGIVTGMVFSDNNDLLPKGLVSIGTISVKGKGAADAFKVQHFLAADANGQNIGATAKESRE